MYEYIKGTLVTATPSYAIVDCGGVGYRLEISVNTYSQVKDLDEVKLLVHYVVREDAQLLYGFYAEAERDMFRLLININGIGVNTARVMLSSLTVDELRDAVTTQNVRKVQSVKGIGNKTAQRIILELQDKLGKLGEGLPQALAAANHNVDEALSALTMLGFPKAAADKALQQIAKDNPTATVEELIKAALGKL